ncbi:RHS repeat-associated core domain-containing protein [Streptomyces xanthophaeus]|uniref:RHS repeat-associated core domain-containing protein n=1 Tax=Streptomyces xanthophaeus TaxID=67385 RepID=UPI00099E0ADB|nr:RHS repeat-associated core domain-containing protein [Streptomyces xanthophaeus]
MKKPSKLRRRISVPLLVALSVFVGTGTSHAAQWQPKDQHSWSPEKLKKTDSVTGKNAPKAKPSTPKGDGAAAWRPKDVSWPPASQAEVDLGAVPSAAPTGTLFLAPNRPGAPVAPAPDPSRAGAAPVWVSPGSGSDAPRSGKAAVQLTDKKAAEKAGVQGLLLAVRPADALVGSGPVKVSVDVSHIAGGFGGDWLSRARLVTLPECAVTSPERAECRTQTPASTVREGDRPGLLTTEVSLRGGTAAPKGASASGASGTSAGTTVLGVTAAPGGAAGTYTATSLAPSGKWTGGGNGGGFSWSYPIVVPDGLGADKPRIELSYSSQSVDGRTAATNNQSSWVGEGWDYSPGFIEQSFKPCSKDGQAESGDLCISGHNVSVSLGGTSSALVRDDASGAWRLENDDVSKVERLTGADNGDNNGEYWKVTTVDGTQYYFGVGHKPGSSGTQATRSTWTMPVYGNNTGEECHKATLADSWCQQAWRWNLDFVVDPHGNMITHWYDTETNHYKRGATASAPEGTLTAYIRAGTLNRTTYGSRFADPETVKPTSQVLFTAAERCLPDAGFDCAPTKLTKANAAKWPDVPLDQHCGVTGTCENYSATFWTTKRLAKITTQVLNSGGGYDNVDSYELKHEFLNPQDGTAPSPWLASLTRTGHDGSTKLETPPVTFTGQFLNNRVDSSADNKPAMNRRRLVAITSETGQVTDVAYAEPDCSPGAGLPSSKDGNTTRCYPVYWNPDDNSPADPTLDWFHKYVVAKVTERDSFAGSRPQEVRYEYVGAAAWHRDDEEQTEAKRRTWNQFRGYEQVITRAGTAPDAVSKSAVFYLRGMDGDVKADGSKRTATFTALSGETVKDSNPFAGTVREAQTFVSDGGELATVSQHEPWLSDVTSTHSRGTKLPALTAQMKREGSSRQKKLLADKTWRTTSKHVKYEDAFGMELWVQEKAEGQPDTCTIKSYARDTTAWIVDRVSDTTELQGSDCTAAPTENNTLSSNRTLYDGQAHGVLSGPGQVSSTQELDRFEGGQPKYTVNSTLSYDPYGRVTGSTDAAGAKTTTSYEPAAQARPTTVKVTNAKDWTTTTTLHALRGAPVKAVDQNIRVTEVAYDALGRTTAVWQPGRSRSDSASTVYSYDLTNAGTSSVTTQMLRSNGSYAISISILDALGQQVQVQSVPQNDDADRRVITDTWYDSHGRAVKTNNPYVNAESSPVKTRFVANENVVPSTSTTLYDGLGREVADVFSSKAQEQWRTVTSYPGTDRTDTIPPKGDSATSVITDALGRSVERRAFKSGKPEGAYDTTRYAYDPDGKLTRITDAAGNAWTYDYDFHGRQIRAVDPDKGTSTVSYDAADRPVATVDARGTAIHTVYDILGRPTSRNLGAAEGTPLATYEYDTVLPGQRTASTRWVDGKPWRQEATGYDAGYRPTGTKLTVPAGEGALSGTYSTSTSYDPVTGLERRTDLPAAGGLPSERLTTTRNANGLPVSYGSGTVGYVNFTNYDELGQVRRTTLGADPRQVSFTNVVDPATGRLLSSEFKKQDSGTAVDITNYTYTPAGDVTSVTNTQGASRDTQCFTYDYLRRLTEAWTGNGTATTQPGPSVPGIGNCANATPQPGEVGGVAPYHQSFMYDVTGNRTSSTDHDPTGDITKATTTTHTYPAPGSQRPHTPTSTTRKTGTGAATAEETTYDLAGNTLARPATGGGKQTLTWTPEGNLASATTAAGTSTYVYDAEGNRLVRKDPGKTTLYLGPTELTLSTTANTVTGTRYYVAPGGLTIVRSSDGKVSYVAADHHNTGTTAIDSATLQVQRRATKPFGEFRGGAPAAWPGERGYVGGAQDKTTGLTHLGAREYDPLLGRFLSVDPIIDYDDPAQMNAYSYAHNNPVSKSDPDGLRPDGPVGGNSNNDERWAADRGMSAGYTYSRGSWEWRETPRGDPDSQSRYRAYRANPSEYKVYHYNPKDVEYSKVKAQSAAKSRVNSEQRERESAWGKVKGGLGAAWNSTGGKAVSAVSDHWRGITQTILTAGAFIGGALCVAATAGLCGGVIAGYVIAAGIGATAGVASYSVSGGKHTAGGYVRAGVVGGVSNVGQAYAGKVALRLNASFQFRGSVWEMIKRMFTNSKYWKP